MPCTSFSSQKLGRNETKLERSWDEVGTKFDDCGKKLIDHSMKYNPEVFKYRCFMSKYSPPRGEFPHLRCIFDDFGIVFRIFFWQIRT